MDTDFKHEYEAKIDKIIEERGQAVQAVFGGEDEIPFAYSVGRAEQDKAELISFTLHPSQLQYLIKEVSAAIDSGSAKGVAGELIQIEKFTVRLANAYGAQVTHMKQCPNRLARVGKEPMFEALQIIWPDEAGKFPDEEGYQEKLRQPIYENELAPRRIN